MFWRSAFQRLTLKKIAIITTPMLFIAFLLLIALQMKASELWGEGYTQPSPTLAANTLLFPTLTKKHTKTTHEPLKAEIQSLIKQSKIKDDELIKKDNELVEKDNELVKKNNELVKKDNELVKKDNELENITKKLTNSNRNVKTQRRKAKKAESENKTLTLKNNKLTNSNQQKQKTIDTLSKSVVKKDLEISEIKRYPFKGKIIKIDKKGTR